MIIDSSHNRALRDEITQEPMQSEVDGPVANISSMFCLLHLCVESGLSIPKYDNGS